jgi:hypothetical protein
LFIFFVTSETRSGRLLSLASLLVPQRDGLEKMRVAARMEQFVATVQTE